MTHLDIIKEAYDKCGISYKVFTNEVSPAYQYLIFMGYNTEQYEGLSASEALRKCRTFMEFYNGKIASY